MSFQIPASEAITSLLNKRSIPGKSSDRLSTLPPAILDMILSYLWIPSLTHLMSANESLRNRVIAATHINTPDFVKRSLGLITERLNQSANSAESITAVSQLVAISETLPRPIFSNLQEVHEYIFSVQSEAARALVDVNHEITNGLLTGAYPRTLLAKIPIELHTHFQREIKAAIQEQNSRGLEEICIHLLQFKCVDWAVEVANSLPDESAKSSTLRDIAPEIAKLGYIDRALEIAKSIPYEHLKSQALSNIALAIAKRGDIDRALDIAKSIHIENEDEKLSALSKIAPFIDSSERFNRAFGIADTMNNIYSKSTALVAIAKAQSGR